MKFYFYILCLWALAAGCHLSPSNSIANAVRTQGPELRVVRSAPELTFVQAKVYFRNEPFSGYVYDPGKTVNATISLQQYRDGRLDGITKKWYANGRLMECRIYSKGQKNGLQASYWENGLRRFEFTAVNDAYEGRLKEWDDEGHLVHLANFVNGQEEGPQKLWYEDGKIRANYVIIGGKRYGLLGTKNCKNVSDSIFVVK